MDSSMFDGIIKGLLLIGAAIGLAIAGLIYGGYQLFQHVQILWK